MTVRLVVCIACLAFSAPKLAAQPGEFGDPSAPIAGTVLGTPVHTSDAEELRYMVLSALTERYAQEQGISVSQTEKDAYIRRVDDAMRQDRMRAGQRRSELQQALAAKGLPDARRKSLTEELESVNSILAADSDHSAGKDAASLADKTQDKEAREQMATAFIRQWKINGALYRHYGGRVIYQQGGPEPLDAYRRFLEERKTKGDFKITDRRLETAFWRYYRNGKIHSFYPRGSNDEKRAFDVAPWARN